MVGNSFHARPRRRPYGLLVLALALMTIMTAASAHAKTYLVNGILSATPIGYGFKNLKQKIPNARLFLMVTGFEAGSIKNTIVNDIRERHAANPSEAFSLAGGIKSHPFVLSEFISFAVYKHSGSGSLRGVLL